MKLEEQQVDILFPVANRITLSSRVGSELQFCLHRNLKLYWLKVLSLATLLLSFSFST